MHPWFGRETLCLWWGSSNQSQADRSNRVSLWDGSGIAAAREFRCAQRRELNILAKVIENIGFGSEPERDSRPLSFSMKGMVFFLAFFSPFLSYAWDQAQASLTLVEALPQSLHTASPPSSILFRQIITFPRLQFLKYLFLTDLCASLPFSLMWGRPSRYFLVHRTHC